MVKKNIICLEQWSANYGPWAKSSLIPVFVTKFYWNMATSICLHIRMAELSSCASDTMLPAKSFIICTFTESFTMLGQEQYRT